MKLFQVAEQTQAKDQPDYPLLYSLQGFQYCELLLTEPERAAWQVLINPKSKILNSKFTDACRAVYQRAKKMFEWRLPSDSLLTIALDHLTLGRAALYQAILENFARRTPSAAEGPKTCPEQGRGIENVEAAVSGLRQAGTTHHLPRALLTRAWLLVLEGDATGAQGDLDEAWEIAERGPMPLYMVDIHLYRARLFFGEAKYPWDKNPDGSPRGPKDDLSEARRLIFKHGYLRRKEELEDAEQAILDKKKN